MGAGIGALLAAPLLTILYLAQQLLGLPFAAFDLFDWLARRLPGGLITSGIGAMVAAIRRVGVADTSAAAKTAEQGLAIAGLFLALVVAGAVLFAVLRRTRWSGIIAGLVLGALAGGAAPVVREADWRLRIGGLVGRPAELSLAPGRSARRLRADASVHHARVHLEPRRRRPHRHHALDRGRPPARPRRRGAAAQRDAPADPFGGRLPRDAAARRRPRRPTHHAHVCLGRMTAASGARLPAPHLHPIIERTMLERLRMARTVSWEWSGWSSWSGRETVLGEEPGPRHGGPGREGHKE